MKLTPNDRAMFATAVERFGPVPAEALANGLARVRVRELDRGEHLLRAGLEVATTVAFVVHGLLREYFVLPDGSERTKAFVVEGQASGSLADLLSEHPSRANIVAEEGSRLLTIPYAELQELGGEEPAWAEFGRRTKSALLQQKADREYELLALDAHGRYEGFRARFPGLEARVKAIHIASYLGITPVHLSRLRRRERAASA